MPLTISIEGVEKAREKLGLILSQEAQKEINAHVGSFVVEKVKDHLDQMSVSRHKVADRLGATHTKYFEYASGRVGGVREDGTRPGVDAEKQTSSSVTIAVKGTPGLRRAFGPMTITPKKAKALTIPIHRISYAKSAKQLASEGHVLFRIKSKKGNSILAENDGTKGGIRPLYVLVKKSVIPQDKGLLPSNDDFSKWASRAAIGKLREMTL